MPKKNSCQAIILKNLPASPNIAIIIATVIRIPIVALNKRDFLNSQSKWLLALNLSRKRYIAKKIIKDVTKEIKRIKKPFIPAKYNKINNSNAQIEKQ